MVERLPAEQAPSVPLAGREGAPALPLPQVEPPRLEAPPAEKEKTYAYREYEPEVPLEWDKPGGERWRTLDPLEVDAVRRRWTVARFDGKSGKLKRAYLHVPVYANLGAKLERVLEMGRRGFFVPAPFPTTSTFHYYPLGPRSEFGREFDARLDPIHQFSAFPGRHILRYPEMKEYGVLLLNYIDVESTQVLVRYLLEGGFALVSGPQLVRLEQAFREGPEHQVVVVSLTLEHPLFRAYYDVERYYSASLLCPGSGPLSGVQVDGRLVALVEPLFVADRPCGANRVFFNALSYGLIQSGAAGWWYRVGG
jgi:hypothetical protein